MKLFFSLLIFITVAHSEINYVKTIGTIHKSIQLIDTNEKNYSYSTIEALNISGSTSELFFHKTIVRDGILIDAVIINSDFSSSFMNNMKIVNSTFKNTNFHRSSMKNITTINSEFIDCDLSYTDFRNSNIKDAIFGSSNLTGSKYNSKTQLPFSIASANGKGMVFEAN